MEKNLLSITILCFVTSLFYANQIKAQCHIDDWTALKALYESTNGDGWFEKGSWTWMIQNPTSPPGSCNLQNLYGVNLENGRVVQIDLHENNLIGTIPHEIGILTYLKRLYLDNNGQGGSNQLTGSIPPEIGNLFQLQRLYLSYNQLTGEIPNSIGNLTQLGKMILQRNQLTGDIPSQIGNLTVLTHLYLYGNSLSGILPSSICNLNNLIDLRIGENQLEGSLPSCIGNIGNNLQYLYLQSNNFSGNIPASIGSLNGLKDLFLNSNSFTGTIPSQIGNLSNIEMLGIGKTYIEGNIPTSFGNLTTLKKLWLSDNYLSGSIPTQLTNLLQLIKLDLRLNQLSGTIPQFSNQALSLHAQQNYFTCSQIQSNLSQNQQLTLYEYEPQFRTPSNYTSIQSYVINQSDIGQTTLTLTPNFGAGFDGTSYQWRRNNKVITGANNPTLTLQNIEGSDAGKYTLHFQDQNCSQGIEFISDPIYVIVEGYDIYGYSVNTKQVMVEFDNPDRTTFFENVALLPNGGIVKKSCNCNRELYLWEFSTTEEAVDALVKIDKKLHTVKDKSEVDGGFNNNVKIGVSGSAGIAYNILSYNTTENYSDEVTIFLLDTGLDATDINTSYLLPNAPVDNCYNLNSSSGYNYTGAAINDSYTDEVWHGTFGFRAITDELTQPNNIKIVPLKIFDEAGEGNLFDMTCAIYHAIDHNANIINISAGFNGQPSAILENAINSAREQGVFICAAAGNDALNVDITPQYPACYASEYKYNFDESGLNIVDSSRYNNVISVAAINAQNGWANFSNFGQESVTLSAYGTNIHSYGLGGNDIVASGTSMASYFVTRELALEIASNKNRSYEQIWSAFNNNRLTFNIFTIGKTRTAKQLDVPIEVAIIGGCTDPINCNYFEFATYNDGTCNNVCSYDCVQSINLQDIVNDGVYTATETLECNTPLILNSNVRFYAGQRIKLKNGFSSRQSQSFVAAINECAN